MFILVKEKYLRIMLILLIIFQLRIWFVFFFQNFVESGNTRVIIAAAAKWAQNWAPFPIEREAGLFDGATQ